MTSPVLRFELRVTFLNDWHVGIGAGLPGSIDRVVAREAGGLPYVPAKTLTGIWRDACEQVAYGLDDCKLGDWSNWISAIFGSEPAREAKPVGDPPRPATLSVRPAFFPTALRDALRYNSERVRLRQAATILKPGVKIDALSGRALDEHLRTEEMARAGSILVAPCTLDTRGWSVDQRNTAAALLNAGAQFAERLGGKRRRGVGRARFEVTGLDSSGGWLEWIEETEHLPGLPPTRLQIEPTIGTPAAEGAWCAIDVRLHLETAVVVPAETVGNVVESLDHVPGTFLLPLIDRAFTAAGLDPAAVIAAGDVIALPATLEIDGDRGQPVPMALSQPKDSQGFGRRVTLDHAARINLFNRFSEALPKGVQEKAVRGGYLAQTGAGRIPARSTPATVFNTHNTVDDDRQRPTTAVGGVYSYEALAAGQTLRTQFRLRSSLADALAARDADWWPKLAAPYRLGRSKKDDYGAVRVEPLGPARPLEAERERLGNGTVITVWLLSGLLLRSPALRPWPVAEQLRLVLETQLGAALTLKATGEGQISAVVRQRRHDTWQSQWSLPRPTLVAIEAGSCFRFEASTPIDSAKLAKIEAAGLGERRAEGFGQIRFNDPLLTQPLAEWEEPIPRKSDRPIEAAPIPAGNTPEHAAARVIERAAWRTEIVRAATAVGVDQEKRQQALGITRERPTLSQLGTLRSVLGRAKSPGDEVLTHWIEALTATGRREEAWKEVRPKLAGLSASSGAVWAALRKYGAFAPPSLTADADGALEIELWHEALTALMNACIRGRARQEQAKESIAGRDE